MSSLRALQRTSESESDIRLSPAPCTCPWATQRHPCLPLQVFSFQQTINPTCARSIHTAVNYPQENSFFSRRITLVIASLRSLFLRPLGKRCAKLAQMKGINSGCRVPSRFSDSPFRINNKCIIKHPHTIKRSSPQATATEGKRTMLLCVPDVVTVPVMRPENWRAPKTREGFGDDLRKIV